MRKSVTVVCTDNDKFLVEVKEYDYINQTQRITRILVVDTLAEAGVLMSEALSGTL